MVASVNKRHGGLDYHKIYFCTSYYYDHSSFLFLILVFVSMSGRQKGLNHHYLDSQHHSSYQYHCNLDCTRKEKEHLDICNYTYIISMNCQWEDLEKVIIQDIPNQI